MNHCAYLFIYILGGGLNMNRYCYNADISMNEYKKILKYNNIEALELSIKYPKISLANTQAEDLINNQIMMEVSQFIRYSRYLYKQAIKGYHEAQANDYPFHSYSAFMEYTVTYNENCFLSLYFDRYVFTGGAHGNTVRSSDTWELCYGTKLSLSSFFKPGTDYKSLLIDEMIKQAEVIQQKEGIYFDDYKELIIKNFNEDNFYLSPLGITIYYQQYDVAPYSTGIVEFTIPYSIINWRPNC